MDWLHLHASTHGWRFVPPVAAVDGDPVGVVPLLLTRRGPVLMEVRVPFPHVGPVVPQAHLLGTLSALDAWARRNRLASSRQEFAPITPIPFEPVRAAGWDVHHDLTLVVDFSHGSVEESWRGTHGWCGGPCVERPAWRRGPSQHAGRGHHLAAGLLRRGVRSQGLPSPYDRSVGELVVG